ncbi:leucine-rich repeat flightless-interacting protein 1 isoform X3 [Anolis sagrei]|uniref:leucine-rich repeat flightless-interacting protein 1 isoform X3 n=1 Tax=Anolis sagrei TaxID=38937 RepID=UPI0035221BBF
MEAMGSQQQPGSAGRKRIPNRERPAAEDDALNQIAREAEARLAAKRAARAEAREIRMKELERQQKEIYQVQKKYYGLDTKFGDIEQWMEDSERYTRKSRRNASASDEDERMSVGSRGSLRASCYSDLSLHSTGFPSKSQPSSQNGNRASLYDENFNTGTRRYSASSSRPPSEYSCYIGSGSRASSRASSARASPVVEERPEKDFEKIPESKDLDNIFPHLLQQEAAQGVRTASSLSAATLASLGGTSSRRGSGDTSISVDTEASIREIKDINELKDQIQDVEGKYKQELKEMKDSLAEVEEKYKKAMVSNAQLDNEKTNFMYQVDNLKDALFELEEELAESKREYDEKSKEFEREKHAHNTLKFQFVEVKEALKQREELLAEIRQLQQKQEGYVREISDLQETIEWKEKKIGALERQKEFFDSIRCERDDLREEVVLLKEQLKQYGIIPNLEVATNGETSGGLHNDGLSSSSKMVSGTSHIPGGPEDGMLGKANEVEMKNEIVENVGKREILQNTEHEEHTEETKEQEIVQECSEIKTLHADENAEAEKITEGKVASTLVLNSGLEEPPKSHTEHVPGIVCSPKNSDVVEFCIEGRSIGDTSEEKELNENDVNKVSTQSKETSPGIEVGEAISTGLEMLPQKQNNEKQAVDVGEDNHNEIFQDALEFVNDSQAAASSDSETPDLVGDMLSKTSAIHSDIEQSENKIIEDDLLIKEQGITITTKEKQADGTDEDDKKENVVQHQSDKADSTVEHTEAAWAREQTPDDLTEEQGITITTKEKQGDGIDEDDKMENVVQHQSAKADSTVEHTESSWAREETPDDLTEEQGITITTKEKQDGGTDEDDKKENVVQQQSDKADTTVEHTESAWGREQTPDDLTEEQIQVEETQTSSSSHDSSTEEEDIEQQPKASEDNHGESLAKGTEQREAVLRTQEENAISEKNDKQISMTDINPENIVVDGIEQNECQTHERKQVDLKNESRKGSKLKTEIINDEKTLVEIPYKSEDAAAAESQDNPAFTEEPRALEFVNDSQAAVSSHSETPDLVGDLLSKTSAIHSDIEQSENKIIEGDLLIKEQGITITNEEKQDDGTDEDDKKENVVQQQSDKADSTVEHTESSWAKEQTLDDLTEEEIQVGAEETQTSSSNHDSSTEEEDIEQQLKASEDNHGESLAKGTEQGEAVLRTQEENAISEKNDKQISMTDIHPENIVDAIEQNECQTPERKQLDLKDDSRKACQESQSDPQVGRIGKGKSRDDCVIS